MRKIFVFQNKAHFIRRIRFPSSHHIIMPPKIVIRRVEPDDSAALQSVFSGPRAFSGTLQLPYPSVDMWKKRLASPPEGTNSLVACIDSPHGEVIGEIGLHTSVNPRRKHVASMGMAVRDDWQGKGVGSTLMTAALDMADRWLNLERIELTVYTDNEAAIGLYKKLGFVLVGTLSRYAFRDGKYIDAYAMARLRPST
eukprot:TRINITY_DN24186_c0_g1_i1.p1 TRINITY_DN24186_c0_g1~~TRINITY_DN24186_c0_g1_i1.p1  ORF type:complete len:197 (+),score=21.46 TRINITY_DN24186_c0_g1_i1:99-689(+)